MGFDVLDCRTVPELRWERDDVELLKWARRHRRILLGFDLYKKQTVTGVRLLDEINRRNGRVIKIAGGPQQPHTRAIGKLLVHQERWEPWFGSGHGMVRLGDQQDKGVKFTRPHEMPRLVVARVQQGVSYLDRREAARLLPQAARSDTAAESSA